MRSINTIKWMLFFFFMQPGYAIAQQNAIKPDSLNPNKNIAFKALGLTSVYYASSLYVLGKTWYKGRERVPFHFYNDNKGYLQVDKLGHSFGAYAYSYVGYHFLLNSGLSRRDALLYGATLGLVLQTPVEIMDGVYEGYGFSWGDMAANSFGSALVLGQELLFKEQLIKFKFSYWESIYSQHANGYLGTNTFDKVFNDYNGHTYWLSCPINLILPNNFTPGWLNMAIGYGANGMYGEFVNITEYNGITIPPASRYRQFLFSVDVDWTRIKTDSKVLNLLLQGMAFVKLPFPALEYNSKGGFKAYYIYY